MYLNRVRLLDRHDFAKFSFSKKINKVSYISVDQMGNLNEKMVRIACIVAHQVSEKFRMMEMMGANVIY